VVVLPGHQDQAVRAGDPALVDLAFRGVEPQLLHVGQQHGGVEDAHDDLLAEGRRHARDAQLHLAVGAVRLDASVLGAASLGDVHARHHLDARRDGAMHRVGHRLDVVQDPVDAEADRRVLDVWLQVDVRGALLVGVVEQVVHRGDDVLVAAGELVVGAHLDHLHQLSRTLARTELLLGLRDLRPEAVDAIDHRQDVGLGRHHVVQGLGAEILERLAQRAVEWVDQSDAQAVGVAPDGNHHVVACEGPRERLRHQIVVDPQRIDLVEGDAGRFRQRPRDRVLVDQAVAALGVGQPGRHHQLGGRHVVARRRLRAHRSHLLLQHAAAQRGGPSADLLRLLAIQHLALHQQIQQLFQGEGRAQVGPLDALGGRRGGLLGAHAGLPLLCSGRAYRPPGQASRPLPEGPRVIRLTGYAARPCPSGWTPSSCRRHAAACGGATRGSGR